MDYNVQLANIMPPSKESFKGYSQEEWQGVEDKMGTILPLDYKKFINTYGSGCIGSFIWVLSPFTDNENVNLIKCGNETMEAYKISKQEFPEDFTHLVYPEKGGILPCAITDNGDEIYWLTNDEKTTWQVIIYESRSSVWYQYNMGIVEFIYKIITRAIICPAFPDDLFEAGCSYN